MTDNRRNARRIGGLPTSVLAVLAVLATLAAPAFVAAAGPYGEPELSGSGRIEPNSGLFPSPYLPTFEPMDRDGDGVMDDMDAFPLDPAESIDFDGDGVGDNADAFPFDPVRSSELDRDCREDSVDTCPDGNEPARAEAAGRGSDDPASGF